jgi:hypothetical protein
MSCCGGWAQLCRAFSPVQCHLFFHGVTFSPNS